MKLWLLLALLAIATATSSNSHDAAHDGGHYEMTDEEEDEARSIPC